MQYLDPVKPEDLIERVLEGLLDPSYQSVIDVVNARDLLITFDELHEKLLIREVSLRTQTNTTPLPASIHATSTRNQQASPATHNKYEHHTRNQNTQKPSSNTYKRVLIRRIQAIRESVNGVTLMDIHSTVVLLFMNDSPLPALLYHLPTSSNPLLKLMLQQQLQQPFPHLGCWILVPATMSLVTWKILLYIILMMVQKKLLLVIVLVFRYLT